MIDRNEVIKVLAESKLTASELVDMTGNLFSISQACQWMNETKKISKPVMYLLWRIAKDKLEKSSGKSKEILEENDLPEIGIGFEGNSVLVSDKVSVMDGGFIKKANGYYFNYEGDLYLNKTLGRDCSFERHGKEIHLRMGLGSFGKYDKIYGKTS